MAILGAILLDTDTTVLDLFDANSSTTINAGTGRSGGKSIRGTGNLTGVTKTIGANVATLNVAFAYNQTTLATASGLLLQFQDAGTLQCNLKLLADGTIQALRNNSTLLGASSAGAVVGSTYSHIECAITISATVGAIQVWVNSVSVLNLTGLNTKQTANATVSGFTTATTGSVTDWCDFIWGTTRITDLVVDCQMPTGAGSHTDFTPSTGANWQNVDEVPPNTDTDYNETATVGAIDSFAHAAISGAPSSIAAVIVQVRARNTAVGSGSIAPFLRSGSTDSAGTDVALNTTYKTFQSVYPTDPDTGSAWASASAVNAAEIGYKKTV